MEHEMRLERKDDGRYYLSYNGEHIQTFDTFAEFAQKVAEIERKVIRDPANGQIMEV